MIRRWGPTTVGVLTLLVVILYFLAKLSPVGDPLAGFSQHQFALLLLRSIHTLIRWFGALVIGVVGGLLLGTMLGLGRLSRDLIVPSFDFLRFIPVVLMIPIIRRSGLTGEWMYFVLTGWTGVWITTLQIARGVRSASRDQMERAACLNWGRFKRARHIQFRWVCEYLAGSIEQAGTACFLVLIAVEMLGPIILGEEGLGNSIIEHMTANRPDLQVLDLVAAGCIGLFVGYGCRGIARLLPRTKLAGQ